MKQFTKKKLNKSSQSNESVNSLNRDSLKSSQNENDLKKAIVLLRNVPRKSDNAWKRVHDSVMNELDRRERRFSTKIADLIHSFVEGQLLSRPIVLACVLLTLFVTSASLLYWILSYKTEGNVTSGEPIIEETILPTPEQVAIVFSQGNVSFGTNKAENDMVPISTIPIRIESGNWIRTGERSSAVLSLKDGSRILLQENSALNLSIINSEKTSLFLARGSILAHVTKQKSGSTFDVECMSGTCHVVGTKFLIQVNKNSSFDGLSTDFAVIEGRVKVSSKVLGSDTATIDSGSAIRVFPDSVSANGVNLDYSALESLISRADAYTSDTESESGSIAIESSPSNAQVWLNGTYWGVTPISALVKSGNYSVKIIKNGFTVWQDDMFLENEQNLRLSVSLNKKIVAQNSGSVAVVKGPDSVVTNDAVGKELLSSGYKFLTLGKLHQALEIFAAIIERDSSDEKLRADAAVKAFQICQRLERFENAISYADLFIENKTVPDNQRELVLFDRASLKLTKLNNLEGAIEDYTLYCITYPDGVLTKEALRKLSVLIAQNFKQNKITKIYKKIVENFAKSQSGAFLLFELGICWEDYLSNPKTALGCYSLLLQKFPSSIYSEETLFRYARSLQKNNNTEAASKAFDFYLNQFPSGKWAVLVKEYKDKIQLTSSK